MIVKAMLLGAFIGLIGGIFLGAPIETAVGGILGIVIRKN